MAFSEPGTYRVGFDFSGKLAANGEETREKYELLLKSKKRIMMMTLMAMTIWQ